MILHLKTGLHLSIPESRRDFYNISIPVLRGIVIPILEYLSDNLICLLDHVDIEMERRALEVRFWADSEKLKSLYPRPFAMATLSPSNTITVS